MLPFGNNTRPFSPFRHAKQKFCEKLLACQVACTTFATSASQCASLCRLRGNTPCHSVPTPTAHSFSNQTNLLLTPRNCKESINPWPGNALCAARGQDIFILDFVLVSRQSKPPISNTREQAMKVHVPMGVNCSCFSFDKALGGAQ